MCYSQELVSFSGIRFLYLITKNLSTFTQNILQNLEEARQAPVNTINTSKYYNRRSHKVGIINVTCKSSRISYPRR